MTRVADRDPSMTVTERGRVADLACGCQVTIVGMPAEAAQAWREHHRCGRVGFANEGGMYGQWGMYGMPHRSGRK